MNFNTTITLLTSMRSLQSSWLSCCASRSALQVPTVPPLYTSLRVWNPVLTLIDGLVRYCIIRAWSLRKFLAMNTTWNFLSRLVLRDHVSQGWTYLTGPDAPNISISIDGVDKRLLERARQEVPTVLLKVKRKIYGKRHRNVRQLSPGECLKAFMDPHFLG